MTAVELLAKMGKKAETINQNAQAFGSSVGYAIEIPPGTPEEVLCGVDQGLVGWGWTFVRTDLAGRGPYYVLFPFG